MKQLSLLASAVALATSSAFCTASDIAIGAGGADGEYTKTIVPAISKALQSHGYAASPQLSVGSQQNMEDLTGGTLDAVLVQMDVAAMNLKNDESERYLVLGRIAPEALLCAIRKDGRVRTYHDLTDDHEKPLKISVGAEGGGTGQTFEFLMNLDPELRDIKLIYKQNKAVELSRLASGNRDAVCFMMMPNPDNDLIELVANNKELRFMEFVNPAFEDATVDGLSVYDFMEVPVSPGVWGLGAETVKTLVTQVALVVDEEGMAPGALNALATVLLKPDLLPPTSAAGKANEMWGKVSDKAGSYYDDAKRRYEEWQAGRKGT